MKRRYKLGKFLEESEQEILKEAKSGGLSLKVLFKDTTRRGIFISKIDNDELLDVDGNILKKKDTDLWNEMKTQLLNAKSETDISDWGGNKGKIKKLLGVSVSNIGKGNNNLSGGRGSGGGASNTKITESAQCVYNQCIWNDRKTNFTNEELTAAYNSNQVVVDASLQEILDMEPMWVESSIKVAKYLHKIYGSKRYKFYRGGGFQSELDSIWKILNKNEGRPFGNLNKWNPADIWMVADDAAEYEILNAESIQYLNNELKKAYKNGDYIGISLKKVEGAKVVAKEVNYEAPFSEPRYNKTSLTGSKSNRTYWSAKDGYIIFDGKGTVQFRTFPTFQCEIVGKSAKHGKVSGGSGANSMMGKIMNRVGATPLQTQAPLKALFSRNKEQFMIQWYDLYSNSGEKEMSYEEFKNAAKGKNQNWCVSKYLATQVFNNIKRKEQKFLSELIRYAKSESVNSAVHLKIGD